MPDDLDLEFRRPVWIALADLFLDTDVRMWYAHVARRLAESPYAVEELRLILRDEVTPALQGNLLDIAGEWAGFDDDWVVREILDGIGKRRPVLVDMDHHWMPLARLIVLLRSLPTGERLAHARAWDALIRLFMDKRARISPPPADYSLQQLEWIFRTELWPVLIDGVTRLAARKAEQYPAVQDIEANWISFAASQSA